VPGFKTINTLVSLFSSFNTLGRMLVGFLSDRVTARWGTTARVSFLVLASALMCLVQLYFAFAVYVPMLYPGVIFLGLAYGATFCIVPTLALEFFGFKYFGTCPLHHTRHTIQHTGQRVPHHTRNTQHTIHDTTRPYDMTEV
jgi:nitrate/nitrite transporter NarK